MIGKITEIDGIIDKLESLITTLREERDNALKELALAKKTIDERELDLLQMDEEAQRDKRRFEEERQSIMNEQVEAVQMLENVAARIRRLVPAPRDEVVNAGVGIGGSQTTLKYEED
ncbi:MAG: hypothetical protein LBQ19_01055 [Synergistaceae bacterium]|jgi:chromosome segregation ATPase|nr:hypothetical protein [Synergistaceae bacterium]